MEPPCSEFSRPLSQPVDPAAASSSQAAAPVSSGPVPAWGVDHQPWELTFPFGKNPDRPEGEDDDDEDADCDEPDDDAFIFDVQDADLGIDTTEERRHTRTWVELHRKLLGKLAQCQRELLALDVDGRPKAKAVQYLRQMQQLLYLSRNHHSGATFDPTEVEVELERFRANLIDVQQWPKTPLNIPDAPPSGTCSYFEHPSEGRIKLMWTNPLPIPGVHYPMYECDVCMKGCKAAWQHITLGDERDMTIFNTNGLGYDVCLVCFEEYRTKERTLLNRAAQKTFDPDVETGSLAVWRSELYQRFDVNITRVAGESGGLTVQLQAPATGEYLLCTATSDGQLPDNWSHAAVETLFSLEQFHGEDVPSCSICLDSVLDTTEGRIRPIQTKCGHFFHETCLRKQFRGLEGFKGCRRCPICRAADPLDLQSNPDIQLPLELSLQTDCRGEAFVPGARYLVVCFMAADQARPVESYSCASFQATTYLAQS